MTPVLIPCQHCAPMAVWGTLVVASTHFLMLRSDRQPLYLCGPHAALLERSEDLLFWEQLT